MTATPSKVVARYGSPIHTPPSSMPRLRSHPMTGAPKKPTSVSMVDMVVFSVATVCGSTTALSSARHRELTPTPMLVMTMAQTNSHGTPARAVSRLPAMKTTMETRARNRSRLMEFKRNRLVRTDDESGSSTSKVKTPAKLLTVLTYVAYKYSC